MKHAKCFDTYETSENLDALIDTGIEHGDVVIAVCKDECFTNLSDKAKDWFKSMGSKEISNLEYR